MGVTISYLNSRTRVPQQVKGHMVTAQQQKVVDIEHDI